MRMLVLNPLQISHARAFARDVNYRDRHQREDTKLTVTIASRRLDTPIMRVDRIFGVDALGIVKEVKPPGMWLGQQVHPSNEAILESGKVRSLRGMRSFHLSLSFTQSDATCLKNKNDLAQRRAFSRLSKNVFDEKKVTKYRSTDMMKRRHELLINPAVIMPAGPIGGGPARSPGPSEPFVPLTERCYHKSSFSIDEAAVAPSRNRSRSTRTVTGRRKCVPVAGDKGASP